MSTQPSPPLRALCTGVGAQVGGAGLYLASRWVVRRNLFVTVEMLQVGGLAADVGFADGLIEVRLGKHCATFPASKVDLAADWLAKCAIMHYPRSDYSKLWMMLAKAAGGAIPFGNPKT